MTDQLPDEQLQLLIADAVRYRFLRDVVPATINEIYNTNKNYDWDKYVGFESIFYASNGKTGVLFGKELDDAIDTELGILTESEVANKIMETL